MCNVHVEGGEMCTYALQMPFSACPNQVIIHKDELMVVLQTSIIFPKLLKRINAGLVSPSPGRVRIWIYQSCDQVPFFTEYTPVYPSSGGQSVHLDFTCILREGSKYHKKVSPTSS